MAPIAGEVTMQWRNSKDRFGWLAMSLHWVMAVMVPGLAAVGLWMTSLNYYSPWYTSAPFWHKSVGLVFAALLLVRLLWRWLSPAPAALPTHSRVERMAAGTAQWLMYAAMLIIVISGYLISTADGSSIDVFSLFSVPATISGIEGQEDIAGEVHFVLAVALIAIAALHMLAALKHHFIDGDTTLKRMLGFGAGSGRA